MEKYQEGGSMIRKSKSKHPYHRDPKARRGKRRSALRTADEFFAMPESMQELHLTRAHVNHFASSAFRKLKNGRYVAKSYDGLLRVLMVISEDGLREVATRDSRQSSKAGKHSAAVSRYLQTGDAFPLAQFK